MFPTMADVHKLITDAGLTTINAGAVASFYENANKGHIASILNALYLNGYLTRYPNTTDQYAPSAYFNDHSKLY